MNKLTIIEGKFTLILFKKDESNVQMNFENMNDENVKMIWDNLVNASNCESAMLYGYHKLDFPIFEKEGYQSATNSFVITHTRFFDV